MKKSPTAPLMIVAQASSQQTVTWRNKQRTAM